MLHLVLRWLVLGITISILTACGGGGGSNPATSQNNLYSIADGNHAFMGALKDATVKIYRQK